MEIPTKNKYSALLIIIALLIGQNISAQNFDHFRDTVWHFGVNADNSDVAPGLIFSKDSNGDYKAKVSDKKFKMNSIGKSFFTNVEACGSYIFYVTKDTDGKQKIFNWRHEPMKGGDLGVTFDFTDGMASAYLGDNKYVFFASTHETEGDLDCYMIDMNKDGGNGEVIKQTTTINDNPNSKITQAIEIVAIMDKSDEYRLVFYEKEYSGLYPSKRYLKVYKVKLSSDKSKVDVTFDKEKINPIRNIGGWSMQDDNLVPEMTSTYGIFEGPTIALLYGEGRSGIGILLIDDDPLGLVRELTYEQLPSGSEILIRSYSVALSLRGGSMVFAGGRADYENQTYYRGLTYSLYISSTQLYSSVVGSWPGNVGGTPPDPEDLIRGGGVKMAYDDFVYIKTEKGLKFSREYTGIYPRDTSFLKGIKGINFSNGLTSPAEIPVGLVDDKNNKAPITVKDVVYANPASMVIIKPIENDTDPDGNEILLSSVHFKNPADAHKGTLIRDADNKQVKFIADKGYTFAKGEKIEFVYVVKDNSVLHSMCNEGEIELINGKLIPTSKQFVDNVWFFGNNEGVTVEDDPSAIGTTQTSKGIVFKKDISREVKTFDASKISKVNAWRNTLTAGTPTCNADFMFYAQHNKVYNSIHEEMPNGDYIGHSSISDGLASAHLGNNIYILISVSNTGTGNLNYSLIDMNLSEYGDMITGKKNISIDNSNQVGEAIELMPVFGTSNKYWLVYYIKPTKTLKVVKIDGQNPASPTITNVGSFDMSNYLDNVADADLLYRIKADEVYSMLALNFAVASEGVSPAGTKNNIQLLNFDPTSGSIAHYKSIDIKSTNQLTSKYMDFVFYDKYLYITSSEYGTGGGGSYVIYQYDFDQGGDNPHKNILINNIPKNMLWSGGGMKMGPDGKIYIIRQASEYMGVINNPALVLDAINNFNENGFKLASNTYGMAISTGLTPPWDDPVYTNQKPKANVDGFVTYYNLDCKIKPLTNDEDEGGNNNLILTKVEFLNTTDTAKFGVTYNKATKEVLFVQKSSFKLTNDTIVNLVYTIRDKGTLQLCDENFIRIMIRALPKMSLEDSCSFHPKIAVDIQNSTMNFVWQSFDGTDWNDVAGSTNNKYLSTPAEGKYRVKISFVTDPGKVVYTDEQEYKILESYKIAGKIWYRAYLK